MLTNLNDYETFDVEKFLRTRQKRLEEKERLEQELKNLSPLPAFNNESGVRGTDISDPTSVRAAEELSLIDKIEEIEECEEAYNYAMKCLEADEREIITGLFEPKMPIWKFRHEWSQRHFLGDTMFYRERERVLKKFGEVVESEFLLK